MTSLPLLELEDRKVRGAFFTPSPIANFMVSWAVRSANDLVLEPSCGEASFLLEAGARFEELGLQRNFAEQLHGSDVHQGSVEVARSALAEAGYAANLRVQDFFEREPKPTYDAVVGNPPYVRYQSFAGAMRIRSLEAALKQGVRLNQLASSWAAFTVHAAAFLKPEGRLALVLPAELLTVNYASEIRRFLLDRFSSVRLIIFDHLLFPGVLEDVILLLAEGSGGATRFELFQARDTAALTDIPVSGWTGFTPSSGAKWTGALLPSEAFSTYEKLLSEPGFETLETWGDVFLGGVTGNNRYFALKESDVKRIGLQADDLCRISPPGSRHLRGLNFTDAAWTQLLEEDSPCLLFCPSQSPSVAGIEYIHDGEARSVHKTYKCSARNPWWRPNAGEIPDLLFTYMNHECPRLIGNDAGVQILNSLYGVRLKLHRRRAGLAYLPIAALNSVTLLGGEILGRSFGGGLLKFEPSDAARLPLPSSTVLVEAGPRLSLLKPQIGALLRSGKVGKVVELVDQLLLVDHLGISEVEVSRLREARSVLFNRRVARGRA